MSNFPLRPAIVLVALMTLLTGIVYPLVITGIAQLAFPGKANGSLIVRSGRPVGSVLIGQSFSDSKYFWGRPSATTPQPYNGTASTGSNLGPLNPALLDAVKARIEALHAADPGNTAPIPVDLVTASASGVDPEISLAAADYQVARVARTRGWMVSTVHAAVMRNTSSPLFGFLGEPRVNVLALNLDLDDLGRRVGQQ
ncbi:MAG TPA: potassium-transporting ATPase subunit KdpC [Steroidobacteraceae bacterium]|jgi:K+-transporting ATPase ATPase C chain|nr:potassium-transporting ATPase subunit KdpC [Steroidobacteraceae bacterium]